VKIKRKITPLVTPDLKPALASSQRGRDETVTSRGRNFRDIASSTKDGIYDAGRKRRIMRQGEITIITKNYLYLLRLFAP